MAATNTLRFASALFALMASLQARAGSGLVVGSVRIQLLSDSLIRIEQKGATGFEDRPTFHIVNRDWPGVAFETKTNHGAVEIWTANCTVRINQSAASLADVSVSANGRSLYQFDGVLTNSVWLPAPGAMPASWSFADTPRLIPPRWGLTPPPAGAEATNGGWDLSNDAPDVYVFLPHGDYRQLRQEFLKLTGPTEMPPLFMFGAFDSRWYDYSEKTALQQIDDYRAHHIPLDGLVVDTGWRKGASTGYQPNTDLFPDLKRFFAEAHAKNVKVMFNDHPEPVDRKGPALAAEELNYRFAGLSGVLRAGLNLWWFDRNWPIALTTPAKNLRKEVWGLRLYRDTTAAVRPADRPVIMANVDGIDDGRRNRPMDVAAHRFPVQWTGDIYPHFDQMRRSVENAVHSGVQSLFPYESDDLGGYAGDPTPEGYIRWIEYGALAPVCRWHCKHNHERMPWTFGGQAESIVRDFVNLRYRLLPVIYAAAHENYETGEPLLRRLDMDFPGFKEASRDDEYLLGKDILVAPVLQSAFQTVPGGWLKAPDGRPGLRGEYFANNRLAGQPAATETDSNIDFWWREKGSVTTVTNIPKVNFSARWTGNLEVPAATGDVVLSLVHDEDARLWVDGRLVLDASRTNNARASEAPVSVTAGMPHQLRLEYRNTYYQSHYSQVQLQWRPAKDCSVARSIWVPPGDWINAWSGETVSGPLAVTSRVPLNQVPLFIKSGAVLPLAPEMQFTGERSWDLITLDLYPRAGASGTAALYEDDSKTTAYQRGEFRTTSISVVAANPSRPISVVIGGASGMFPGEPQTRSWRLRLHKPADWPKEFTSAQVAVNGKMTEVAVRKLPRDENAMPFGDQAGAPDGDVYELKLPATGAAEKIQVEID